MKATVSVDPSGELESENSQDSIKNLADQLRQKLQSIEILRREILSEPQLSNWRPNTRAESQSLYNANLAANDLEIEKSKNLALLHELEVLKTELRMSQENCRSLQAKISLDYETVITSLKVENSALMKRVEDLSAVVVDEEKDQLFQQIAYMKEKAKSQRAETEELKRDFEKEFAQMSDALAATSDETVELKRMLRTVEQENAIFAKRIEQMQSELESRREENRLLREKLSDLAVSERLDPSATEARQEMSVLRENHMKVQLDWLAEKHSLCLERDRIKGELQERSSQLDSLEDKMRQERLYHHDKLQKSHDKINFLNDEKKNLEMKLAMAESSMNNEIQQLMRQQQELDLKFKGNLLEKKALDKELAAARAEVSRSMTYKEKFEELNSAHERSKAEIELMKTQLELTRLHFESEKRTLEERIQSMQEVADGKKAAPEIVKITKGKNASECQEKLIAKLMDLKRKHMEYKRVLDLNS